MSSFPTASEFSRIRAIFSEVSRYTAPTDGVDPSAMKVTDGSFSRSRRSPFDGSVLSVEC